MTAIANAGEAKSLLAEEATAILWEYGNLQYKLWPQQRSIYATIRDLPLTVQTVVVLCARQFGKSVLGCLLALEDCLRNPGVVVMIIGPDIKQTRAIVMPRMKILCKDMPDELKAPDKPFPMVSQDTFYFANGSELKLGGFETGSASQRGKTIHKIYMEETCNSNGDTYTDFLRSDLGPALTHSKHAQIIHLTTLPKIPDHPFALETVPEAMLHGAFFCFTIHDNKKLSPEQFAQCVKLCGGEHTVDFKREYLCEQVRDGSIILAPEFDETRHVFDLKHPDYAKYWIGGDTGGVRDKSAFYLCCYDFKRAKILVMAERWYEPETGSDTMVKECLEMEEGRSLSRHVDAPGQLQIDLAGIHKYAVALPRKDELEATVNQVRFALQTGAVEIDRSCKLLITTLRSGTFNKTRTDLGRTRALGHMDAFMALAYALRHVNKSNPYPAYGGASPHTHFIRPSQQNSTARAFEKILGGFNG